MRILLPSYVLYKIALFYSVKVQTGDFAVTAVGVNFRRQSTRNCSLITNTLCHLKIFTNKPCIYLRIKREEE